MRQSLAKIQMSLGTAEVAGICYIGYKFPSLFHLMPRITLPWEILLCLGIGCAFLTGAFNFYQGVNEYWHGRNSVNFESASCLFGGARTELAISLWIALLGFCAELNHGPLVMTIPFYSTAAIYLFSGLINLFVGYKRNDLLEREAQIPTGINLPGNELNSPPSANQQSSTLSCCAWLRNWLPSSRYERISSPISTTQQARLMV